jgi:hypothetical protein
VFLKKPVFDPHDIGSDPIHGRTAAAESPLIARKFLDVYLTLPNYTNNFLRLGFRETDLPTEGAID